MDATAEQPEDAIVVVFKNIHLRRQMVELGFLFCNTRVTINEQVCEGGQVLNHSCLIKLRTIKKDGNCKIADDGSTIVIATLYV